MRSELLHFRPCEFGLEAPSLNLSGSLSPGIGNLTNLVTVLLEGSNLSGRKKIPPKIGNLSKLRVLDLSNNDFYGQIPASFEHLHNLEFFIVGNPLICGTDSQDCSGIRPQRITHTQRITINIEIPFFCFMLSSLF